MSRTGVTLLAVLTLSCAAEEESTLGTATSELAIEDPDPPDPTEPPIGNGQPCTNTAVVAIRDNTGALQCSAAVLAPDLLLTAGHCVLTTGGQIDSQTANLSVASGATACAHGPSAITGVLKHPQFAWGSPTDLAVVSINPPLSGATAVGFGTPSTGAAVTLTAYGNSSQGAGAGVERCTNGTVSDFNTASSRLNLDFGTSVACTGDSGGPIFASGTNHVVGILYGSTSQHCGSTALAGTDLQFARDALANRPTLPAVACQPGTYAQCLRAGQTCPSSASLYCQFDNRICATNGTWGACQARGAPDPCLTGTVWNQNQCQCVAVSGGGGGGDPPGGGGGWGGGGWGGGTTCFDYFAGDVCAWGGTGSGSVCYDSWGFWYIEYDFIQCYAG